MTAKWWGRRDSRTSRRSTRPASIPQEQPAEPFARLFDYENKIVRLAGGGIFRAMADSVHRWHSVSGEEYAFLGDRVRALYERRDGTFVLTDWACVKKDKPTGVFFGESAPRAWSCDERVALRFYLDHQDCGSTPRMDEIVERWQANEDLFFHPENARSPRPVDYWRGKGYATELSRHPANRRDGRGAVGGLMRSVQLGVELVRDFHGDANIRGMELPFIRFFMRYPVDPLHAPLQVDESPPDSLAPEELDPRFAETEIPGIVRAIRELAEGPTNLLAAETLPESHEDRPNRPERELAFAELHANLPQFVRLAAGLKAAVDRWDQARCEEEAERRNDANDGCLVATVEDTVEMPASDADRERCIRDDLKQADALPNLFRKDGDGWRLQYQGGNDFHLRAYVGCIYIRELLSRPGEGISALELAMLASEGTDIPDGNAGEAVDHRALKAYRDKKASLIQERERAKAEGKFLDVDLADAEIEQLDREIASATGLGGQIRTVGSDFNKARKRIEAAAKRVIDVIETCDSALAVHLQLSLEFGGKPRYLPQTPMHWET